MLKRWFAALDAKRVATLLLGPGFLMLGADAWIGHLAGKDEVESPLQWVPVFFAPAAAVLLVAWALPALNSGLFRGGLFVVGLLGVLTGAAGTFFHAGKLREDLADETLTWPAVQGALALAPPLFAPLAFLGVGALLCLLSHPRVLVGLAPKAPAFSGSGSGDEAGTLSQTSVGDAPETRSAKDQPRTAAR